MVQTAALADTITTSLPAMDTNGTSNCTLWSGNTVYYCPLDSIIWTRRILGIVTLLGCLLVIFVIVVFRKYRAQTQRMILCLFINGAMRGLIATFAGVLDAGGGCTFIAMINGFTDWSLMIWVWNVTVHIQRVAIHEAQPNTREWVYHAVGWGFPFLMALLPLSDPKAYGSTGHWCWIQLEAYAWRLGIWYVPMTISMILMFGVYTYIWVTLNKRVKRWEGTFDPDAERKKKMLQQDIRPLMAYPFIYLLCYIFPLINRIHQCFVYAYGVKALFILMLLHTMTSSLPGALYAIIYIIDRETRVTLTPYQIKVALYGFFKRENANIQEVPVTQLENEDENRY